MDGRPYLLFVLILMSNLGVCQHQKTKNPFTKCERIFLSEWQDYLPLVDDPESGLLQTQPELLRSCRSFLVLYLRSSIDGNI